MYDSLTRTSTVHCTVEVLVKQLSLWFLFHYLDDWEVITGCHQNRTSVPQLVETLVLVGINPVFSYVDVNNAVYNTQP